MAHATEIQALLRAARRGQFSALLAAADYWADHASERAAEFSLFNWNYVMAEARRMAGPGWHAAHPRLAPMDNLARAFRDFARHTSHLHGRCWRIPRPLPVDHPAWEWCKDMAHALLKHVKALEASRAPAGDPS